MLRSVLISLACACLALWGAGAASASTDAGVWDSRTTVPQYVGTPLVELSFAPHFYYNAASGAATPAGIAWWVGNVDSAAAPDTSALPWVYVDALHFTPPTVYWIDQVTVPVELPDDEGRHTIWQAFKAYDANRETIDTFTDFSLVWLDETAPVTYAPRSACCKRYTEVTLRFRVTDGQSPKAKVVIVITQAGRVVKSLSCGWRLTYHGPRSPDARKTFRCALPKGRYRFTVEAEDLAGNRATVLGSNRLTVY